MATIGSPIDTKSSYFQLTTRVTLGTTQFTLYSLLYRGNQKVTPLLRSFGTQLSTICRNHCCYAFQRPAKRRPNG